MYSYSVKQYFNMSDEKPLIVADPTKGIKVNSGVVAKQFRDELKAKVAALKERGLGMCFS